MMTRSRIVLSLSLIALLAGLAAGPASADDSKEFAEMHKAWQKAYNDRDAKALAAMYTEDGTLMPPNTESAKGRAAIEAALVKDMAAAPGRIEIAMTDSGSNGNLGYARGTYTVKDAEDQPVDTGKWLEVRKKINGKWYTYHDIWNSDMAMPE